MNPEQLADIDAGVAGAARGALAQGERGGLGLTGFDAFVDADAGARVRHRGWCGGWG